MSTLPQFNYGDRVQIDPKQMGNFTRNAGIWSHRIGTVMNKRPTGRTAIVNWDGHKASKPIGVGYLQLAAPPAREKAGGE